MERVVWVFRKERGWLVDGEMAVGEELDVVDWIVMRLHWICFGVSMMGIPWKRYSRWNGTISCFDRSIQ